jgi:Txe/YoeB family toxin of Txe-Axe toxin-antitoxin module
VKKKRKGRGNPLPASATAEKRSIRDFVVQDQFREDLEHWIGTDSRIALRVMELMEDVRRHPFEGKGQPEPLKHNLQGKWSGA